MELTSLALRTNLLFHRFDGRVLDRGHYLVVHSPRNPGYYYGNLLVMADPPRPGDAASWCELFAREVGEPLGVDHVTLAWDGDDAGHTDELVTAGFELEANVTLACSEGQAARAVPGLTMRPLAGDADWELASRLNAAVDPLRGSSEAYERFRARSRERTRGMTEAGLGHQMGGFVDGQLVCQMGIFSDGELARFRNVETHPEFRRRGICGSLVVECTRIALTELGARTAVIVAEPQSQAERVYRAAGFSDAGRELSALRPPRSG